MQPDADPTTTALARAANSPNVNVQHAAPTSRLPDGIAHVGQFRHSHSVAEAMLLNRVGRVLQDMSAGRTVTDQEVLQHETDSRRLSEVAYARFEATGNPADRDEAALWLARAAEARKCLSAAYKAAREAEIQRQIAEGVGYFMEQGDAARARLAGGRS